MIGVIEFYQIFLKIFLKVQNRKWWKVQICLELKCPMIKRMIFHENYWNPNWNPYFKVTLTLTHFLFLCNPYILRQKIVYCQREDRIFSTFEDRVFSPTVYFTPRTVYIQLYDRTFSGVKTVYFTGDPSNSVLQGVFSKNCALSTNPACTKKDKI